jgi:hypothetical protein
MPHNPTRSRHAAPGALLLILATLLLSACGSSSASSSSGSTRSSEATKTAAAPEQRSVAFGECLRKNGIATAGAGGTSTLPAGVDQTQYQAAVRKCGGFPSVPRAGGPKLASSQFAQVLAKFAGCMRANGVNVPTPNTSGKGPILDTKGLDPTSAKFVAARKKCSPLLLKELRAHPGSSSPGAPPPGR